MRVVATRSLNKNHARANVHSNLPAIQVAATRSLNTNARVNARSNLPATQIAATRSLNTNAHPKLRVIAIKSMPYYPVLVQHQAR